LLAPHVTWRASSPPDCGRGDVRYRIDYAVYRGKPSLVDEDVSTALPLLWFTAVNYGRPEGLGEGWRLRVFQRAERPAAK
jgi:hypothetical protein